MKKKTVLFAWVMLSLLLMCEEVLAAGGITHIGLAQDVINAAKDPANTTCDHGCWIVTEQSERTNRLYYKPVVLSLV